MPKAKAVDGQVYCGDKLIGTAGKVSVDFNEVQHHPEIPELLGRLYHKFSLKLPAGDYVIAGPNKAVGVERKAIGDLITTLGTRVATVNKGKTGAVKDSRLRVQLGALLETYDMAYLLIEWDKQVWTRSNGQYTVARYHHRVHDTQLWGMLDSLQAKGLRIRMTTSLERTLAMLVQMSNKLQKGG